jgi:hypothetical protein
MSVSHKLDGQRVSFVLPVALSPSVRRSVLLATSVEPTVEQIFVVSDLTELPPELRARIVDIWEKVNVNVDEEERYLSDGESYIHTNGARNDGYLHLQRNATEGWTRYLPGPNPDSIDLDDVFYATPGRTVRVAEYLRIQLNEDQGGALEAMLAGMPIVNELGNGSELRIEDVLAAYERALEIAQKLIDLVDGGTSNPHAWLPGGFNITDDAVFLNPDTQQNPPNRRAAILKQASAPAYTRARDLLQQLDSLKMATVDEKIDRVCYHWWSDHYAESPDERKVDHLLDQAVKNVLSDARGEQAEREEAQRYEKCRANWITKHGSQRLQRAAARGYRHDGIYRDERLRLELPDFMGSLGRKPTIRELVNPSERALEVESQVLARAEALGIPEDKVRLLFVQPGQDSDWIDGEFVQIEDYLGRHTVWRSVSGARADEDIPF